MGVANADSVMRWKNRSRLLVMCYHGVDSGPRAGKSWLLLPTSEFERQVEFLARNYDVLPIDDALARLAEGRLTRPTACITFDDGYLNNYTDAFPVLQRYDLPATVYLATGFVGTRRRLWPTAVELAFEGADRRIDLTETGLDLGHVDMVNDAARAARRVINALAKCKPAEREAKLAAIYRILDVEDSPVVDEFSMMSWTQAREMAGAGISFGGHTVNHEIVERLDDDMLQREIRESISTVQSAMSDLPSSAVSDTFAYPNGRAEDFDDRAKRVVRAAGCTAALSTMEGLNGPDADAYSIRRIVIGGNTHFDNFRARTAGVMEFVRSIVG